MSSISRETNPNPVYPPTYSHTEARRYQMPAASRGELRDAHHNAQTVSVAAISSHDATLTLTNAQPGAPADAAAQVAEGPATLHLAERETGHRRAFSGSLHRVQPADQRADQTASPNGSPQLQRTIAVFRFDDQIQVSRFSHEAWLANEVMTGAIDITDVIRLAAMIGDLLDAPHPSPQAQPSSLSLHDNHGQRDQHGTARPSPAARLAEQLKAEWAILNR